MSWDTGNGSLVAYDPNKLPGTAFICTDGEYLVNTTTTITITNGENVHTVTEDWRTTFQLGGNITCRLFCDSIYVSTMTCENGNWTGHPELGAWCYSPRASEMTCENGN